MTPDNPSLALNVVAFFFPFVGLVVYLVTKDASPRKARSVGKASMAGVIAYLVGVIFLSWLASVVMAPMMQQHDKLINEMMEATRTPKPPAKKGQRQATSQTKPHK